MSWFYHRGWRIALPAPPRDLRRLGAIAIAVGFVLCWSSGFVGSRLAVAIDTPVLGLYAWRFALAMALAALWWALRVLAGSRRRIGWGALGMEAASGSLTVGVYLLAMLLAIDRGVSAGVASLIGALQPLAAATLAAWWLRERSSRAQWAGMLVATLGAGLCVLDDIQGVGGAALWAYGLPLLAVAAVTLGSVMTAGRPNGLPLEARLTAQLAAATVVFFAAARGLDGGIPAPPALTADTLTVMAWLVILATFGGYGFFVASLGRLGVTRTSTLVYLTPPVTLAWTAVLFGELPGALGAIGMGVAALGVWQTLRPRHGGIAEQHGATRRDAGESPATPVAQPPAPDGYASRAKIRSQTPWPSRSPRASNLVSGRKSGRGA